MSQFDDNGRTTVIVVSEQSRSQVELQLKGEVEAEIIFCTTHEDVVGAEKALEWLPVAQILMVGAIHTLPLLAFLDLAEHWGLKPQPFTGRAYN
jgi:hypothetical protein